MAPLAGVAPRGSERLLPFETGSKASRRSWTPRPARPCATARPGCCSRWRSCARWPGGVLRAAGVVAGGVRLARPIADRVVAAVIGVPAEPSAETPSW